MSRAPLRLATLAVLFLAPIGRSGEPKAVKGRINPAGIDGTLVLCGGGKVPDAVLDRFVQLAGGEKAYLVVIPRDGRRLENEEAEKILAPWKARNVGKIHLLPHFHIASDPSAHAAVRQLVGKATAVWLDGTDPGQVAPTRRRVEEELRALLKRGGVIGGAAVMSRSLLPAGKGEPKTEKGFDFLPGAILDTGFLGDGRTDRLFKVLAKSPGLVGIGIDEGTALIVKGRSMRALGEGSVTLCLGASPTRPAREIVLKAGKVADLTTLRRAAVARTEPPFPPKVGPVPEVPKGSLVIVGGGGMPAEVTRKFIDLAGGPDALIVVLPTASEPGPVKGKGEAGFLIKAGARNVQSLTARELKDVEDPKMLDVLKKAKGLWFGGGRQWRFVDAYGETKAYDLLHDVLRRGGVIGGSSAGATIQGDYLCRGSPLGNLEMMCEGYERGFGFLPGVAIDQHFAQRKRFADMTALMKAYPQLLGIGIDEATALVVRGHVAEVLGRGRAHFYDAGRPVAAGEANHVSVGAGGRYDLKARQTVEK